MRYSDIGYVERQGMRHNNLVIYGNSGGHIPPQSIAESIAPIITAPRWTREQAYQWALDTIENGYKTGRLK